MTPDDLRALLTDLAAETRRHLTKAVADLRAELLAEIAAVQAIPGPPGPQGDRGDIGPPGEFDPELIKAVIAALPPARDGKDGRDGEKGIDGKDGTPGRDGVNGRDGEKGADGLSVTVADILPTLRKDISDEFRWQLDSQAKTLTLEDVRREVREGLAALPPVRDGRDGLPGVQGPAGDAGPVGPPGPVGPLGPQGPAGMPGEKGADGLGFGDLALAFDEVTGYRVEASRDGETKVLGRLPTSWDAGVWRYSRKYPQGCNVTWKGEQWTAQWDTLDRPGETKAWRLSVRKGQDGKDAPRNGGTSDD